MFAGARDNMKKKKKVSHGQQGPLRGSSICLVFNSSFFKDRINNME